MPALIKPDKNKHVYVIGIDFGHAETAVALCPIQWEDPMGELVDPVDINLENNKKVIVSAICKTTGGDYSIGTAAFRPKRMESAEAMYVCFKKKPERIDDAYEMLMIEYMRRVYGLIREVKAGDLTDTNHFVYIATPSGWTAAEKDLYRQMALLAGLPLADLTVESRAAFITMQSNPITGIARMVDKGAVVVDVGSSTIDITYLSDDLEKPVDMGYDCGASEVEKLILQECVTENSNYKEFIEKYPDLADWVLFKCRQLKEDYFFHPGEEVWQKIEFEESGKKEFRDRSCRIEFEENGITQMLLEKGLSGCSYYELVKKALINFREEHIPGKPIYGVYLTGSASRMDFLKPLIIETWGLSANQFVQDDNPGTTISRGVAAVGRADARTWEMEEKLTLKKAEILKNQNLYEPFSIQLANKITDKVINILTEEIDKFSNSEIDLSLNDLIARYNAYIRRDASSVLLARESFREVFTKQMEESRNELDEIIRNYAPSLKAKYVDRQLRLHPVSVDYTGIEKILTSINITSDFNFLDYLDKLFSGLPFIVSLFFPTYSILFKVVSEIQRIQKEKEDLDKKKAKKLSKSDRIKIKKGFEEKKDEIRKDVLSQLNASLKDNASLHDTINKEVAVALEDYLDKNIKQAKRLFE